MFVDYMTDKQQAALLHFAYEVMRADGVVEAEERAQMEVIRKQIRPGVEPEPISIDLLAELFDQRTPRVALFLELIGMAYSNEDLDPDQSQLLQAIAHALCFDDRDVSAMYSWVERQFSLVQEASELMEERA